MPAILEAINRKNTAVKRFGGDSVPAIYDDMNEKTKAKIQQSFLQLLAKKNFIKISVQDISKASGINRGTFYLHYLDKYDLLDQMEEQLLDGLAQQLKELQPEMLLAEADKGNVSIQSVEVFRYIEMNAAAFRAFLSEHNQNGFHKRLKGFFIGHFIGNMLKNERFFQSASVPDDYLSAFATSAFLGLIEQWLDNDLTETPEEMAEMYIQIILFIRKL